MKIQMPFIRKVKAIDELLDGEVYLEIEVPGRYAIRIEETNV